MHRSFSRVVCRTITESNKCLSGGGLLSLGPAVSSGSSSRLVHLSGNWLSKEPSSSETKESVKDGAKRAKTPIGKLDELKEGKHPYQEKEPLPAWPDNTNPHTGEVGGPRGPEPTRYGDWERKGRVTDF